MLVDDAACFDLPNQPQLKKKRSPPPVRAGTTWSFSPRAGSRLSQDGLSKNPLSARAELGGGRLQLPALSPRDDATSGAATSRESSSFGKRRTGGSLAPQVLIMDGDASSRASASRETVSRASEILLADDPAIIRRTSHLRMAPVTGGRRGSMHLRLLGKDAETGIIGSLGGRIAAAAVLKPDVLIAACAFDKRQDRKSAE